MSKVWLNLSYKQCQILKHCLQKSIKFKEDNNMGKDIAAEENLLTIVKEKIKSFNIPQKPKNNKTLNHTIKENLSEHDLKNLMSHSSYKRSRGAIRQVT